MLRILQSCKTAGYSPRHVSLHGNVAVQKYAQITNGLCGLDSKSTDRKLITWDKVAGGLNHIRVLPFWRHLAVSG